MIEKQWGATICPVGAISCYKCTSSEHSGIALDHDAFIIVESLTDTKCFGISALHLNTGR